MSIVYTCSSLVWQWCVTSLYVFITGVTVVTSVHVFITGVTVVCH